MSLQKKVSGTITALENAENYSVDELCEILETLKIAVEAVLESIEERDQAEIKLKEKINNPIAN